MRATEINYYRILGVKSDASTSEIKHRYRALSKIHHPDAAGGDGQRMALINEAYATLSDPLKRIDYMPTVAIKTAPIRYDANYQSHAYTKRPTAAAKRQAEEKHEDEQIEGWGFLWWYILAIPLALAIVTIGQPLYNRIRNTATATSDNTTQTVAPVNSSNTPMLSPLPIMQNNDASTPATDNQTTPVKQKSDSIKIYSRHFRTDN